MIYYFIYIIILVIIVSRLTCGRCKSKVCLVGKTALITGGNSGIGYQTALDLASRGCRVIIGDISNNAQTRINILEETKNSNIIVKHLDLSSLKSVRQFAKDIIESEKELHILINNAGVGTHSLKYTDDGLQDTMQVNYFGHFLLTHLLIDLLKKSAPSRIIFTSSIAAFLTYFDIKDLNPQEDMNQHQLTYCNSKLCQTIAAKCFAKKLKEFNITSNSFHPGAVRSNIFVTALKKEFSLYVMIVGLAAVLFGKSTEEGAQTLIHLACDRNLDNTTGQYFIDCIRFVDPFQSLNKNLCQDVWDRSIEYVQLRPEEIQI